MRGELRVAGKQPGCANKAQEEIYDWCREGLEAGRRVVRLKIGDPFVFGRGGEEVLELREALGVSGRRGLAGGSRRRAPTSPAASAPTRRAGASGTRSGACRSG